MRTRSKHKHAIKQQIQTKHTQNKHIHKAQITNHINYDKTTATSK